MDRIKHNPPPDKVGSPLCTKGPFYNDEIPTLALLALNDKLLGCHSTAMTYNPLTAEMRSRQGKRQLYRLPLLVISCIVVTLSHHRCELGAKTEDGVREHTKSYVTERPHKVDKA